MKKTSICALSLILLACTAMALSTATATSPVSVYVKNPFDTANNALGLISSGYWVGQIPITITSGSTQFQTQSYCMNFDRIIYIGGTYSATLAPSSDTEEWRAVSYLLTWNNPTTNDQGAATQVAVWRLLNQTRGTDYYKEAWLSQSIDDAGNALANAVIGKDVVRQGDVFSWVSPISSNMSAVQGEPGKSVDFTAQLTSANGIPRSNVLVYFNVTLNTDGSQITLNSTYVTPTQEFTDSNGLAWVRVRVPADTPFGSTISVQASTKGVWPQLYVDNTDPSVQDLLAMGNTFELTVSTDVCILGYIHVVPESPLGALAAIGAAGVGYGVYVKSKNSKKIPI
jgi:hypothetical protein